MDEEKTLQEQEEQVTAAQAPKKEKSHKKKPETDELKNKIDELNDRLLRTAAEFDNYRKRTEREKQASVAFGVAVALEALIPSLDAVEQAAAANCSDEAYKKGVLLTEGIFRSGLSALGVAEVEAEGKPFDPAVHYAVSREAKEGVEPDTVVTVLQKGYKLGERVIRPAMVVVAQ
jgi:molecular chaperone GrpE